MFLTSEQFDPYMSSRPSIHHCSPKIPRLLPRRPNALADKCGPCPNRVLAVF